MIYSVHPHEARMSHQPHTRTGHAHDFTDTSCCNTNISLETTCRKRARSLNHAITAHRQRSLLRLRRCAHAWLRPGQSAGSGLASVGGRNLTHGAAKAPGISPPPASIQMLTKDRIAYARGRRSWERNSCTLTTQCGKEYVATACDLQSGACQGRGFSACVGWTNPRAQCHVPFVGG